MGVELMGETGTLLFATTDRAEAHARAELERATYPACECREDHNADEPYQVWSGPFVRVPAPAPAPAPADVVQEVVAAMLPGLVAEVAAAVVASLDQGQGA